MKNLVVGFGFGLIVGGAATAYAVSNLRVISPGEQGYNGLKYHPALKYGAPLSGLGTQNMKVYEGFVTAFDTRTRNPAWVLEKIEQKDVYEPADRSQSQFYEDEDLEERFRNRLEDFQKSGYDRGHLVPAASHSYSQDAMNETFSMNNVSPQVGAGFNRTYWARFEKFVKDLAKGSSQVFVVTGPLWLPRRDPKSTKWIMEYPLIGSPPSLISVPTHFYKVILAEKEGNKIGVGAFVMPNDRIDPTTPLARFATPIDDLECATGIRHVGCNLNVHNGNTHVLAQGLKFFPQYLDKERTRALDAVAVEWKVLGTKQLAEGKKLKELPASSSDADKGRGTTDMTVANTEKLPNPSHRQMPPKTGDCICC